MKFGRAIGLLPLLGGMLLPISTSALEDVEFEPFVFAGNSASIEMPCEDPEVLELELKDQNGWVCYDEQLAFYVVESGHEPGSETGPFPNNYEEVLWALSKAPPLVEHTESMIGNRRSIEVRRMRGSAYRAMRGIEIQPGKMVYAFAMNSLEATNPPSEVDIARASSFLKSLKILS